MRLREEDLYEGNSFCRFLVMKLAGSGFAPFAECKDTKGTVMVKGDPTALVPPCSTEERASGCMCYTLMQDPRLWQREVRNREFSIKSFIHEG